MNANTSSVVQDCESEPLYLMVDGDNDVYVNNFLMEQHQIDGLRFLFKQFNKKAPGVIVNFPASCGKSATVAIFLNAVTNVLKNPVLILCQNDADLEYWKEVLIKWSSYVEDDIVLEATNPFIKGKRVFIKKRESLHSYLRRRWSVIILKENVVRKDMFQLTFDADFRICITATDIKKDLPLLNAVYKWLYPKKVTNFNDFVAKENRPKEKFRKSVQLDFLLEDVAIRRYVNVKPFQVDEKSGYIKEIENSVTENENNVTEIESHVTEVANVRNGYFQRSKQVNDEEIDEISGQAFILIDDHVKYKISDQNVNLNSILINNQLGNSTSDQNIILINDDDDNNDDHLLNNLSHNNKHISDESLKQNLISIDDQIVNKRDQKFILINDQLVSSDTSHQNFIFMTDDQLLNKTSDQNVILFNDQIASETLNKNIILIDEQISNGKSDQNVILFDDQIVNETSNKNVIFINEQISNGISNQNFIFMNDDQILNQTSDQNVILFNDQITSETLNKNVILIDEQISNSISDQNVILFNDQIVNKTSNKNDILIDEQISNGISNQNFIFMNDDQILNQTSDQNVILFNDMILSETSNKNVILIDEQISNGISNQNFIFMSDEIGNEPFYQNVIVIDENLLNETSDQKLILVSDNTINENSDEINEPILNESSNPNVILKNHRNFANAVSDQDVILINSDDEIETNINNNINDISTRIIVDNPPIISENNEFAADNAHGFFRLDSANNNRDKVNGYNSTITNKNNNVDANEGHNSSKLEVESFLLEQKPVNRSDKVPRIYRNVKSKNNRFTQLLNIDNNSKIELNEMKDLNDKDLLKEKLIESLHFNDSRDDFNEIKDLEETLIKDESTETESLNFENNSKLDLNKIKDLEETLIKEESVETESLNFEKNSKLDFNKIKDLEETLIKEESAETESLNFENNSKLDLNKMKDLEETLIKEESVETESLNFENNLKLDLNETLVKEELTETESLNFEKNSKLDLNEIKDLRNQLIESLGFDSDVKVAVNEIKNSENKNICNTNLNEMNDLRNKHLLQKRLIESLGLNSDCPDTRKSVKENNNLTRLNEYKDVDNLIKEESTESLSFDSNCRFDKNEIKDLGRDLIKEESSNSLNEINSSNVDPNEKKDLHNKNVLQKQLIESLGLDDVKDEIEETNDEPNDVTENMQNVVEQIATGLEDDEIIVIKIEPEDENVNIVSNKRKSDMSGKDLDSKISEMEEKALKKFKGSLLDSIF